MRQPAAATATVLLIFAVSGCQNEPGSPAPDTTAAAAAAPAVSSAPSGLVAPSYRAQAEAHYLLGRASEAAGDTAAAVVSYEAALSLDPWRKPAGADLLAETPYAGLARICEAGGSPETVRRACSAIAASLRFSSDRLAVFEVRSAKANLQLGDVDRAIADLDAAEQFDSGNPDVLLTRGRAMEASGKKAAALRSYTLALFGQPGLAEAHLARGRLRAQLGDATGAEEDFDAVLSDPEGIASHPEAYRDRAMLNCSLGKPEAAAVDWQVWAGLTPDGDAYLRDLLEARGYLHNPASEGFGSQAQTAVAAWTREGCPEG